MKLIRRKGLSFLLVFVLVLSVVKPTFTVKAEATIVSTLDQLDAAIGAIAEGGSGEITISGLRGSYGKALEIKNKDVTFNLIRSELCNTGDAETGICSPVIVGENANITVNLDDNSSIYTKGYTNNQGVIYITNTTYNSETQDYDKTFTLTVNGGKYSCTDTIPGGYSEQDSVFVAQSGTKIVLTDVVCEGTVKTADNSSGELVINGGKFTNNVKTYAAEGKHFCSYGSNYYVRDKEMTDAFSKLLTGDKLVINYVKPSDAYDESLELIVEDIILAEPGFAWLSSDAFSDDLSKLELCIYKDTAKEEYHVVDVVWNYDADVQKAAQSFIDKFPKDKNWFDVSDLELVNYWVYHDPDSEVDFLANYSGELKSILGNSNFLYNIKVRGGDDAVFYTECFGTAKLIYDDIVYYTTSMIGARAEHAIYVPESTAQTKEALIAAAQKRIDDYIGENVVKITASDETVTEYYNNTIEEFDERIEDADEVYKREAEKSDLDRDEILMENARNEKNNITIVKNYFIASFEDGGNLYFLKNAEGDFVFNVEVIKTGEKYKFVIIRDDDRLDVPTFATVDYDTKISVTTDSSTVPLDTIVEVNKITGGADYDRIIKILDIEENETFDIKLYSGSLNEYITKLEDGKFEVKVPVPEKFEGKALVVYYVDSDNNIIEYQVTVKDGYAIFVTDHFSIYTLAEHTQHSGGTATCCTKAICSVCNQPYGELNVANHSGGTVIKNAKDATANEKGYTGDTYCKGCGEKIADGKEIPATGTVSSPQTGDDSSLWLWMALLFASGGCLFGITLNEQKKRNCQ